MNLKLLAMVLLLLPAFATFAAAKKQPGDAEIKKAETIVSERLKDPSSAQFKDVIYVAETRAVCGKYNAKNGFGTYVGFRYFAVDDQHRFYELAPVHAVRSDIGALEKAQDDAKALKELCANSGL